MIIKQTDGGETGADMIEGNQVVDKSKFGLKVKIASPYKGLRHLHHVKSNQGFMSYSSIHFQTLMLPDTVGEENDSVKPHLLL